MIGLVAVVVLLIGVVTDASVLFLTKRSLANVVDGAALAGAQTLDEAAFYTADPERSGSFVPLDPRLSEAAVRDYVQRSAAARALNRFALQRVQVSAEQVTVSAATVVELPFRRFVGGGQGIELQAAATADTPFR
jgi:uncharacterized membrane protein